MIYIVTYTFPNKLPLPLCLIRIYDVYLYLWEFNSRCNRLILFFQDFFLSCYHNVYHVIYHWDHQCDQV